jgi:hypothetical protein
VPALPVLLVQPVLLVLLVLLIIARALHAAEGIPSTSFYDPMCGICCI